MNKITNIKIRKAKESDSIFISSLLSQLGYELSISKIEQMISSFSDDMDLIYVATLKEEVLSVMSLIFFNYFPISEKICRITSIVVDDKVRGLGLGSKLIEHAKTIALENACTILEVTTSLKRDKTQAYYKSIGFNKTSYKYVLNLK